VRKGVLERRQREESGSQENVGNDQSNSKPDEKKKCKLGSCQGSELLSLQQHEIKERDTEYVHPTPLHRKGKAGKLTVTSKLPSGKDNTLGRSERAQE